MGRVVGYVVAGVVGVGLGVLFGFTAFISGMCNTWGEQCSPEENAEIERLWTQAFAAPFVVTGAWTIFDLTVLALGRRRRCH